MTLTGKIIEIGELAHLSDQDVPERETEGVVILVPREQLDAQKENLIYAKVRIELVK
jgi:hypothetical protein